MADLHIRGTLKKRLPDGSALSIQENDAPARDYNLVWAQKSNRPWLADSPHARKDPSFIEFKHAVLSTRDLHIFRWFLLRRIRLQHCQERILPPSDHEMSSRKRQG